jgi:ABC-type phosphate transport system substrate-binding protein
VKRRIGLVLFLSVVTWATLGTAPAAAQERVRLIGSGASFPFPLYSAWFKTFSGKQKGVAVDYQAKGSGAGIVADPAGFWDPSTGSDHCRRPA